MKLIGENRSTRGKSCPSATLSTTNPTWADPGSNPSLRSERPAINRLSHGTAYSTQSVDVKARLQWYSRGTCFKPPHFYHIHWVSMSFRQFCKSLPWHPFFANHYIYTTCNNFPIPSMLCIFRNWNSFVKWTDIKLSHWSSHSVSEKTSL
jgi:hypothetical protein